MILIIKSAGPHGPDAERNIYGLIFQGVHLTDEILKKLHEFPCPVVLGNQGLSGDDCEFTTVTVDSYGVARDITEFLVGDGHKRIAYVGGNAEDYTNGQLRLKGYRDAMKAAGLEIPDSYIYQGNFSTEAGVEGMKKNSRKTAEIFRPPSSPVPTSSPSA